MRQDRGVDGFAPSLQTKKAAKGRLIFALIALSTWLGLGMLCVALLFPLLPERRRGAIRKAWMRGVLRLLAIEVDAGSGVDESLPIGLVVANHVSYLDIPVINALLDVAFVAKSDVAHWPLIGWLTRRTGNLFVIRGSARAAHETHRNMAMRLECGQRVAIFPEGTTSTGEHVLPFHGALFQSALAARRAVICLAISYHDETGKPTADPAFAGNDSFFSTFSRIARHRRLLVRLYLAGIIEGDESDRRHLAHRAHQLIARQLERQRGVTEASS